MYKCTFYNMAPVSKERARVIRNIGTKIVKETENYISVGYTMPFQWYNCLLDEYIDSITFK